MLERLGAGGMGEVFLAEDTRLHRQVALKRLTDPSLGGAEPRTRLLREARAAARLNHPGIATIHDVFEDTDGVWIVMEYVPGDTLADRLGRSCPTVAEALDISAQLAEALDAAHAQGVLHCDLKPANVRITARGQVKILDFGLAQRAAETADPNDATRAPEAGLSFSDPRVLAGTPGYIAPERFLRQPLDARSDVYSLGVVMFETLTGRRLFGGSDLLASAMAALSQPPPNPSSEDPAIPAAVGAIVVRALARNPGERFGSAREMAAAIRASLAGGSGEAEAGLVPATGRPGTSPSTSVDAPRWKWVAGAAAGAVAVVALTLFLMRWPPFAPAVPQRTVTPAVAVKPFVNRSSDKADDYLGFGIADDLTTKLAQIPSVTVVSRSSVAEYLVKTPDSKTFARDLGASYVVDGTVQRNGDTLRVTVDLLKADGTLAAASSYDGAVSDLFTLHNRVAEGVVDRLDVALTSNDRRRLTAAPTANVEAFADYSQGLLFIDHFDIKGNIDHAIEAFQRAIGRDGKFALAHAGLGLAYWYKYNETKDAADTTRAIDATTEALSLDSSQADVHVTLGVIHQGLGRRDAAEDDLRQALRLQPNHVDAHRVLGDILAEAHRTDEAVVQYRKAIALRPNYWKAYNSLGQLYQGLGRYAEATESYRRVAELQPDSSTGFNNLGTVCVMAGDLASAVKYFTRAAEIAPRASTYSNIGTFEYEQGHYEEAGRVYQRAIDLQPANPQLRGNLGDALTRLGQRERARAAYAKGIELAANLLKVNPKDAKALSAMAVYEAKVARPADARQHADRAVALAPEDSQVLYRRAVVRALAGDRPAALAALKEALGHGKSAEQAKGDDDLGSLRGLPEFNALVKR